MGDPVSFGRVQTSAPSGTHRAGKSGGGKTAGGGGRHVTPQVRGACGIRFVRKWGEGPATAHKKAFRSGKGVHVRGVSPVPSRLMRDVSAGVSHQRSGRSAGSCPVCSSAARGDAAGPGSRVGNHRCRLGWEGSRSGSVGLGSLLRRFAGAASTSWSSPCCMHSINARQRRGRSRT